MTSKHELGEIIRDGELADGRRPDPPPENPPPGPKWQAKAGVHLLRLNGAESAILFCMIDHANGKTGLCYPSQPTLARVLNIPESTVRKAIASLNARGLVESLERFDARGRTSNAYLIAWAPLFAAYSAYVTRRRNPKVDATPRPKPDATPRPKVDATPRPKVDAKSMNVEPMNGGTKEVEPMALSGVGYAGRRETEATNGHATEAKKGQAGKEEEGLSYAERQTRKYVKRPGGPQ